MNLQQLYDNKVEYQLTLLILSLPNRFEYLSNLLKALNNQTINKSVQVIYLGDQKSMTVGEKRNYALTLAKGRRVGFIDDDDMVAPQYIDEILWAAEHDPEVITFNYEKYTDGQYPRLHTYHKDNARSIYRAPDGSYKMLPNHLCIWRKDVIKELFAAKNLHEDHLWAEAMTKHYSTIYNIDKVLYYYNYSKAISETH